MIAKQKTDTLQVIGVNKPPRSVLTPLEKTLYYCCVGYIGLLTLNIVLSSFFGFSLATNYISDLGSARFIPFPYFHDAVCVFGGIVSLPFNYFVRKKLRIVYKSSKHSTLFVECGFALGIVGNVGYIFLGVFSLDRAGPGQLFHGLTALFSLSGYAISIFFYGLNIVLSHKCKLKNLGIFGMVVPISLLVLFFVFSIPVIEWSLLCSILVFLVLLNFYMFKV